MNGGPLIPQVHVVAPTVASAAAARAAIAAAGIESGVARVVSEPDPASDAPLLFIAESASDVDEDALTRAPDVDFVLCSDIATQLVQRVLLLHRRCEQRRAVAAAADEMRRRTMQLTWDLHAEQDIPGLARTVLTGTCRTFGAEAAVLVVPADRDLSDGAHSAFTWISRGAADPQLVPDLVRVVAPLLEKVGAPARPQLASDGRDVLEVTQAEQPEALADAFGAEVQRVLIAPVYIDEGVLGELLVAFTDAADETAALEKSQISRLAMQVGRAISGLRARYREQQTRMQLHEATAELQRLVDERDDLGVVIRSIADAVNVGVMFYDTHNRPQLHNRMVEKLLALTGFDPATGRSSHVYASDRRTPVKQDKNIISETLEGDSRGLIYWIGDPAGEQRAVVTEAHDISRPDGERLGAAVVTYDVTDLANAIEIREEYLATVSHELRTPLTSIVGYLDLIEDAHDVDALGFGKEFRTIQHSAEQMLTLLRDLLSTSTRELALRIEPTDVSAVVTQSVSTLEPTIAAADQHLELHVPQGTVLAHVDGARVKQVVDNLISNAAKYTPDGGTISVTLARDEESVVISVSDTGRGIDKTDQGRLFDRFFRSREAREAAIQGVGIGLSIVRTIVDAHGGTVNVESEPGHGSTFTVRLPLRAESTPLPTLPMQP